MKTNTIKSLQQRLKAKGFNPGPIDGVGGPWTFAAWSGPKRLDLPFRVVSHTEAQAHRSTPTLNTSQRSPRLPR